MIVFILGKEDAKNMELRLIESREDILNPKIVYKATVLE